ncbi:DUF5361 domain-containing protein [Enterococcus asini]|uniref:DUF5361 domain-containing protein n=1 Tax=Enterococcus asini TaxID=57732 RepID=UPI0022DEC509|nr:DUF5361 domain-containing protein [Enterococcus asini]
MIKLDEDALICDLAETYHIFDYEQLPLTTVAVFSCGLREDSRIKMRLANQMVTMDTMLSATIVDRLGTLIWFKTKDGQKGKNRPPLILESLNFNPKEKDVTIFDSGEEFEKRRLELLGGVVSGN